MQIANYIQEKFGRLREKVLTLSDGHNSPVTITVDIKCVHLTEREDKLVEVEVRDGEKMGWIYREDVEFLSYEMLDGHWIIINFRAVRSIVENLARKSGKKYCDSPTAYHVRKAENGVVYYYITTEDLKSIHDLGI